MDNKRRGGGADGMCYERHVRKRAAWHGTAAAEEVGMPGMHTNPALPHLDRPPHIPHRHIRVCKLERWWGVTVPAEGDAAATSNWIRGSQITCT